jgi:hypothetical protein
MELATMIAHTNEEFANQDWLADSGENTHFTTDPSYLTNLQPFDGPQTVGVGNGAGLHIQQIGTFLDSPASNSLNFLLKNIQHCPSASANLLSVNKFCKGNKC